MILLLTVAVAAPLDPLLAGTGVPDDADVRIDRGDPMWTVTIDGRPLLVPTPRTSADEDVVRALVISLLSGLDLVPAAPLPPLSAPLPLPPPAVRAEPVPVAPPPPAPVVVMVLPVMSAPPPAPVPPPPPPAVVPPLPAPEVPPSPGPPVIGWVAAEVVVRPGISPGAGGTVGVWYGRQAGVGLRLAGRAPRAVSVGGPSTVVELDTDVELWGSVLPQLSWIVGGGAAFRRYAVGDLAVGAAVIPHAAAGILVPVDTRVLTLAFGASFELDLGVTHIGREGEPEVLPPAALRIETRIAPARAGRTTISPKREPRNGNPTEGGE